MKITPNKTYKSLFEGDKRYYILMGGRASGRSYTASQYALLHLIADDYFRCAIMRFVLGDIRNSIYQEIVDRLEEQELEKAVKIRDLSFEYRDNQIKGVGFRKSSSDQKSKLKSLANYNCVIIEEADEVSEEDFMQLDDSLRTAKSDIKVILLLNPPDKNHWIIKRWFNLIDSDIEGYYKAELKDTHKEDTGYIFGTYRGNMENLNKKTIANFQKYKETKPDHYYNMIQGLVSEGARGRIFKNWTPITVKEFEDLPYPSSYGLDFGFSNDPTALIEIKTHNQKVWVRELIYEKGLTNQMIADKFKSMGLNGSVEIIADSAEPKSIEELRREGFNVKPATKGKDSVNAGVQMLLGKQVFYTEESENIAKESQNYKWALDKNKEPTNKPVDEYNHAIDSIRYLIFTKAQGGYVGFI